DFHVTGVQTCALPISELRFVAKDGDGTPWNVVYNLTTGSLDGRPTDEERHAPVVELLESLHKQHHFPANFGPTFYWALFADLTEIGRASCRERCEFAV